MEFLKYIALSLFILGAMLSYLIWLDSGCEITGIMTFRGKVCLDVGGNSFAE